MITTPEKIASNMAARIEPQLLALAVGESMNVRGYKRVTRCPGENRFTIEGDTCEQKASEAAYEVCFADITSHL